MGDLVTRRIEVSAMHLHWVFDENNRDHQTSDLELLKPALVYGDHVRLFTPNDSFITFLKQSPDWDHVPPEVRLRIAQQVFKVLATQQEMPDFVRFWASENVENYGHFLRTGELQGRNPELIMTVHNILKDVVNEMFEAYRKEEPGADSIIRLAESGLVSLSTPYSVEDLEDVPDLELPFEQLSEEAAAKLPIVAKRIRKIWESPNAFPLFDEALGSLAELLLAQGPRAHSKGSGQQRELALADVFFGQLPGFPKATIDELLDIRTDLQDSLQRFRIALAGISEELAETRSMDEFHGEARSLWVTEVLPAVQEIEDSVRSNKYLYQLTEHFLTKRDGLVAAGGVVVGAMGPHDVPTLVLSAAASALPAARALWEAWKANLDIRHNKFYFVYSLDRRLRQIGPNQ